MRREESSEDLDPVKANIRNLQQINSEMHEKLRAAESKLERQQWAASSVAASDLESERSSLQGALSTPDLKEINQKLAKKLAAARERIRELESRIENIEKASAKVISASNLPADYVAFSEWSKASTTASEKHAQS